MIFKSKFNSSITQIQTDELYQSLSQYLAEAGIELSVTRKRVKNINFRLKPYSLSVSAPKYIGDAEIINAISKRVDWAVTQHAAILKRQPLKQGQENGSNNNQAYPLEPIKLWGEPQSLIMGEEEKISCYRHELHSVMPSLFKKWEPVVGVKVNETRIKKMKTRWGSCNTRAKRVWLSVYLPAYPIQCTEYVIVHELCHLLEANHSPAFWQEVKRSMPDYKKWHDMLAGKSRSVD